MQTIIKLIMSSLTSLLIYFFLFIFIIHKPLTVGIQKSYYDYKINYISSIATQNKIAIFAGSNGRFSHRCETIEQMTGIRCANLSITADTNIKWAFSRYKPYFKKGDVLYMPLEYQDKLQKPSDVGNEAPYIVAYDHKELFHFYNASQLMSALFWFDIKYFFSGLGEMLLSSIGKERRFSIKTMTVQGDESGHDEAKSLAYRHIIATILAPRIDESSYKTDENCQDLLDILKWGKASGVKIIGGLPTVFEEARPSKKVIRFLQSFFQRNGHCFLILPNYSLYPRVFFYDTAYHLKEANQIYYSKILAPYLYEAMHSDGCPIDFIPDNGNRNP
jgi:hypothetical protein